MSTSDSDYIRVLVINSGTVWKPKVSSSTKINKLISLSVTHFNGPSIHPISKSVKHQMVLVKSREVLSGEKSLAEEGLKDNDEVLLVECKVSPKQPLPELRGPTASEIYEATKHVEMKNVEKPDHKKLETKDDLDYPERFSKDSSRIFITLVEIAARLLAYAPNGMEVLQQVKKEMSPKREHCFHSGYVKKLTDMGFPERMVLKALAAKKMNVSDAMEWLLEQSSSSKDSYPQDEPSTSQPCTLTVYEAFHDLLQSALRKKQENFKVNLKIFEQLKQMGFEETHIELALKETDNNMKAAMALLAENAVHAMAEKNRQSLDPNGPLFKALMGSDIIQLNLKKPKFILALLSMLEDPQCLSLWLKDREISSILDHLIIIHNIESSGGRRIY